MVGGMYASVKSIVDGITFSTFLYYESAMNSSIGC